MESAGATRLSLSAAVVIDRRRARREIAAAATAEQLLRGHGGSGLGLALVGRLAELHGGSVALESEPGRGTTVSVSVPSWPPFQASQSVPSIVET